MQVAVINSPENWTADECESALYGLLQATLKHETLTAEQDAEVLKIVKQYTSRLDRVALQKAALEGQIEAYYVANRKTLEVDGRKSAQFTHGLIGMRLPSNPALVPIDATVPADDKFTWKKIAVAVKALWGKKYFLKPKPPGIDKVKLKKLPAKELAIVGLKLDDTESFYLELNRLAEPTVLKEVAA